MEKAHQAILDSLPARRRRSKLEPYAALIQALRARGRSYREIVAILRERCGLHVAMHTIYYFVRARAQKNAARRPLRRQPSGSVRSSSSTAGLSPSPSSSDRQEDVRARIAAAKRGAPAPAAEPKAFEYDESKPLQLVADINPRKR
jgi:IS30 family transposase